MNEQLGVKTSYLVMVGKLFVTNGLFLTNLSKNITNAVELDYDAAKKLSSQIGGVLIRKTVEYEVTTN